MINTPRYKRLNIISLHGDTGSGKDTLANALMPQAYHAKFASQLREDTVKLAGLAGSPAPQDDLAMRKPGWSGGKSFKECMVDTAKRMLMVDPYRYCRFLAEEILAEEQMTGQNLFVVSDCRKVIELDTLLHLGNVWAYRVIRPYNPYKLGSLDHVLKDVCMPLIHNSEFMAPMTEQLAEAMAFNPPYSLVI